MFKVGDKVICIDDSEPLNQEYIAHTPALNQEFVVLEIRSMMEGDHIKIDDSYRRWHVRRFKKYEAPPAIFNFQVLRAYIREKVGYDVTVA